MKRKRNENNNWQSIEDKLWLDMELFHKAEIPAEILHPEGVDPLIYTHQQ